VPVSVTVCGEPAALSVTFMFAVNVAADAGVNVTVTVQDLAAVSAAPPQLLVWLKSAGLAPVLPIAVTDKVPPPELVMVKVSVVVEPTVVDGKLSELVESFAIGPGATPVPVIVTV
jgi:hypothetical protein